MDDAIYSGISGLGDNHLQVTHEPFIFMSKQGKDKVNPLQYKTLMSHEFAHAKSDPFIKSPLATNKWLWLRENSTE